MKPNIGQTDRIVRIIIGIAIIVAGITLHTWWGLVGLLPIGSALVRFCGLYPVLKIDTTGARDKKESA
ncbi:MAG: DUF2892 domain-containing protein [candidate division Zixibacteria bacterium]|nr:DUF2892 domain-containing protein [candidate division Zixibacteria bacterium]